MKALVLALVLSFSTFAWGKSFAPHGPRPGFPCFEKMQMTNSARKALDYCLQAWRMFTQPTDPEPESCSAKLKALEASAHEYRSCVKAAQQENNNNPPVGIDERVGEPG